jgi:hypothetical protein
LIATRMGPLMSCTSTHFSNTTQNNIMHLTRPLQRLVQLFNQRLHACYAAHVVVAAAAAALTCTTNTSCSSFTTNAPIPTCSHNRMLTFSNNCRDCFWFCLTFYNCLQLLATVSCSRPCSMHTGVVPLTSFCSPHIWGCI